MQKYNTETTAKKEETKMTDKEFAAHEERYQAKKANQKPHPSCCRGMAGGSKRGYYGRHQAAESADARAAAVILQRLGLLGKGVK